jgi:3-hydroxyisobutyrate dehydrogenase-like beta-hydroxyacid dehydrogenase
MSLDERIGILGVGRMGLPIAHNLLAAGYVVTVFDTDATRSAAAGGAVAESAAGLAERSDILITVLPGMAEIEGAMIGAGGLIDSLPPGALWLDLTSNDPRIAHSIEEHASARDIQSVGAPMGGGVSAARDGSLQFFVGGTNRAVDRARPVLEALGSVDHVGEGIGDGYLTKLLANLLWFGQAVAVTEALLLGQSLGLSPAMLRDQLAATAGGSVFIDEYLDRLLAGDYLETFGIDRCVEELETLVSLARGANVPFELSSTIARLHRDALERFGAIDGELLAARLLEELAGTVLRADVSRPSSE